jgi:hypothetical protein
MLGYGEDKLQKLREVLARENDIDLAVEEFRKIQEESANQTEHRLVDSEDEVLRLLNNGWELDRELNGGGRFIMRRRNN